MDLDKTIIDDNRECVNVKINGFSKYRMFVEVVIMIFILGTSWATLLSKVNGQDVILTQTCSRIAVLEKNIMSTEKRLERLDARQELMLGMLTEMKNNINVGKGH